MVANNSSYWEDLRSRLTRAVSSYGAKAKLAKKLGVSRQVFNAWLSGASAPPADLTLQLLEWVTAEEAQQNKSPEPVAADSGRKTRSSNPYEKTRPSRKKR